MGPEKRFENQIKKFLKDNGCWYVKYWAGGGYTRAGVPDLLCCIAGHFVAIEVKSERGRPSELQLYEQRKIMDAGGACIILYPDQFESFKNFVKNTLQQ